MKSLKLTPGKVKALNSALDTIEAHIIPAADIWATMPEKQRHELLAHSPVLARFIALAEKVR